MYITDRRAVLSTGNCYRACNRRPAIVRRTKQAALATREAILDAAESVFHDRGVAHASLEEIAQSAGCTRGAVYWHFKDKAELFDAMMQRVAMPAEALLGQAGAGGETNPLALLRLATIDVLKRTTKDPRMQRVFEIAYHKCEYVGDAAGVRSRHVASQSECLGTIEAVFRECVARGLLPASVSPREAAIGTMSLVSGLIANWVLDPKGFSLSRHAESLVDAWFRGLATAGAASAPAARPARSTRPARRSRR
jgi:TetR/AcrR family acrAB operon transcriptional repressor